MFYKILHKSSTKKLYIYFSLQKYDYTMLVDDYDNYYWITNKKHCLPFQRCGTVLWFFEKQDDLKQK